MNTFPAFAVRFDDNQFMVFEQPQSSTQESQIYSNNLIEATVKLVKDCQWELNLKPKIKNITEIYFPWQSKEIVLNNPDNNLIYYPFLSGTAQKNDELKAFAWWGLEYPGSCFAPLSILSSDTEAIIVAATNWQPRRVTPMFSKNRLVLLYKETININSSKKYNALIAKVNGDSNCGEYPWHLALDYYKNWMKHQMTKEALLPLKYPEWMKKINGFISCQLENYINFDIKTISDIYENSLEFFPWIQFWGQMSDYALNPGGGCCLLNQELHQRYLPELMEFAKRISENGDYHVGYYSRPDESLGYLDKRSKINQTSLEYVMDWMYNLKNKYYANAFYLDTLGAIYWGKPLFVAKTFNNKIPSDSFIEFMVDIYPSASLISGSMGGAYQKYGWGNKMKDLEEGKTKIAFPSFGRYLLNDRIVFLGGENGDHVFCGKNNNYALEREAFLLGAKYSVIQFSDSYSDLKIMNYGLSLGIEQRNKVSWWEREPIYLDKKEIEEIPNGIDVRRFEDKNGKTLFVIDNWNQLTNQKFMFKAQVINIPSDKLSILVF